MKKYSFYVPVEEKQLIEFLSGLTNDNKLSETTLKVMRFIMINGFEELQNIDALKKEKIKADIEYKKVSTEFIRAKLKFTYNFESEPSNNAAHAIKEKIKNDITTGHYAKEEATLQELITHKWNNYCKELRVMKDGWTIVCRLCDNGFLGHLSKEAAIDRLKSHLEETHSEELVRVN